MIDVKILDTLKAHKHWVHDNGVTYEVLHITNLSATKPGWEPQVVYHPRGEPDNVYSRDAMAFYSKFRPVG